jgi:dolichyl-phosphate-mannose--protein O-mannosyl transferase
MSHISFSSIRIDTTRVASRAEPTRRPSPARAALFWHAAGVAWLLSLVELVSFLAHALVASLVTAMLLAAFWWTLMRRGGSRARIGAVALCVICGAQALAAVFFSDSPLMISTRAELYATVAFATYALFGKES